MSILPTLTEGIRSLWPRASVPSPAEHERVARIRELARSNMERTEQQLRATADELRQRVAAGSGFLSDDVLPPAFGLVCEAARRTLRVSYYDVQLLAGLALTGESIAEMKTGEGKTLVAALPAFVRALAGNGVHVMTVNCYLAERDYEELAPLFQLLGMRAGLLRADASREEKRAVYACDVVYGPGYEFGFDYLRDQAALLHARPPALGETYRRARRGRPRPPIEPMQRGHAFAIVDEVDGVLLDEATTPLVLAEGGQPSPEDAAIYAAAQRVAETLKADEHFVLQATENRLELIRPGSTAAYAALDAATEKLLRRPWTQYVEQALHARLLLARDVDYIVDQEKVMLVDVSTGRVFADRSWRDGLHQAVETKEGVPITAENRPLARIARQQYFRLYGGLCGMTGTATGSEREFWNIYSLPVSVVPLRLPCRRTVIPARFFADQAAKWRAVAASVAAVHECGQPVLVGTRTISNSERLAAELDAVGVPYHLLNGKQDADEAHIVARAGERGAVTIATNMAGRGTDIRLAAGVVELGGLHVIGTEPHESRRIDRQLMGRAARQGDAGSAQFFIAADDRLIDLYAPWFRRQMQGMADGQGEIHADLTADVARVQRRVERMHYTRRRKLLAHETWLEGVLSKLAGEE